MSRRLTVAAVLLLGGVGAHAEDYSAGKTPAQLFASDCTACHRSPGGLAKGMDARSLAGFLREHYTTSPDHASALASYLASVGGRAPASGAASRRAKPPAEEGPAPSRVHTSAHSGAKAGDGEGGNDAKPARKPHVDPSESGEEAGPPESVPARKSRAARAHPANEEIKPPRPPRTIIQPESGVAAPASDGAKRSRRAHRNGKPNAQPAPAEPDRPAPAEKGDDKSSSEDAKLHGYASSGEQAKPAADDGSEITSSISRTDGPSAAASPPAAPGASEENANSSEPAVPAAETSEAGD
ncbi:MAG TPA: hypothetical protein VHA77_05895 [Xanthobacteraceae bacterium]|nr:hypothetical protein [Xanthobacteraceae bacterium]